VNLAPLKKKDRGPPFVQTLQSTPQRLKNLPSPATRAVVSMLRGDPPPLPDHGTRPLPCTQGKPRRQASIDFRWPKGLLTVLAAAVVLAGGVYGVKVGSEVFLKGQFIQVRWGRGRGGQEGAGCSSTHQGSFIPLCKSHQSRGMRTPGWLG
jgi:hypothetical protein